ncbi:unnamed protein product [Rotaria socialis]|uniref:Uncharacterized protein n=1 Tax=Rotaria socialis TaxID=392032 RepID=A0A821IMY9_9BILA|nr:unnamed protein product [Rotaria socialis]
MSTSGRKIIRQVLDEYYIDAKGGFVVDAAIALITGLINKRTANQNKVKKAINTLVKYYDKYPNIMSSLGLGIGIISLIDSNNDRKVVRRLQGELIAAFKKYPHTLWEQRLTEIQVEAKELKTRQLTMGALKFIMSISIGYLAYASTAGILAKTALAAGSTGCGMAGVINGVNYYNLHELIKRLERDDYLN